MLLQIVDPDGTHSFSLVLLPGDTACSLLEHARSQGKLTSLTIDDSWLTTYGSLYVREINGYSNKWVFEVNSAKIDVGCSHYTPLQGDSLVWKFKS